MKKRTELLSGVRDILSNIHPSGSKWLSFIIGAYLYIILLIQAFIVGMSISPNGALVITAIAALALIPVLIFLSPKLIWAVQRFSIDIHTVNMNRKQKIKTFVRYFLIAFAFLFILYWINQPGGFSTDSIDQIKQAIKSEYNDWHPALHTLIVFTLPLKLTRSADSIVLFQIIEYSLTIAYMAYIMTELGRKRFAYFSLMLILLNPITWKLALYPWKDTFLAITALLVFCYGLRIYFSNGEWLKEGKLSILKIPAVALFLSFATISRHNAVLFTVPFLIALLLCIPNRERIRLVSLFLVIMILIKGPLYSLLNVEDPGGRNIEVLGLPLTVVGSVIQGAPNSLDEETREFIYTLSSKENWEKKYVVGDFNSIKFGESFNKEIVNETDVKKTLSIAWKCLKAAPVQAIYSVFKLTNRVYAIVGGPKTDFNVGVRENDLDIAFRRPLLAKIFYFGCNVLERILLIFHSSIGIINFLIILVYIGKRGKKTKENLIKFLFGGSLLCYNFGTMLLLSSPDDFRFFYISISVFPALMFLLFSNKGAGEGPTFATETAAVETRGKLESEK